VTPTAYATQAVAAASGALTITGGVALVSSVFTTRVCSAAPRRPSSPCRPAYVLHRPDRDCGRHRVYRRDAVGRRGTNSISDKHHPRLQSLSPARHVTLSSFRLRGQPRSPRDRIGVRDKRTDHRIDRGRPSLNQVQAAGRGGIWRPAPAPCRQRLASPGLRSTCVARLRHASENQPVPIGTTDAAWADLGRCTPGWSPD